jgi:hypothetical protein
MNHSQFLDLCRDISTELNLEDLDELGFSNYLEIDDIPMAFIFDEHSNPDRIFCYVDHGPIEDSQRLDIYDNLLTLNLLSGTKTNGIYALDPTSGHVLFVIHNHGSTPDHTDYFNTNWRGNPVMKDEEKLL